MIKVIMYLTWIIHCKSYVAASKHAKIFFVEFSNKTFSDVDLSKVYMLRCVFVHYSYMDFGCIIILFINSGGHGHFV